jgi:hypothetical protein
LVVCLHPLPGFFKLFKGEETPIGTAGEGIQNHNHACLPIFITDENSLLYLVILVVSKFEIIFDSLRAALAFEIIHHHEHVDYAVCTDGFIRFGKQGAVIFGGQFTAYLETNTGL